MRVLITGGDGFIGGRLAARIDRDGAVGGRGVDAMVVADLTARNRTRSGRHVELDVGDRAAVEALAGEGFDLVFHLAAIPSAGAEADFEGGYRTNLDGTRHLLETLRANGNRPRLVFTSTFAVYGGDLPEVITDTTPTTPQTSYGSQKAMGELMVADYSRRGFIDGRSLRLPTIMVRPGAPNTAASTFASSILREPLKGLRTTCPVPLSTAMYVLSPRRVVDALLHAAVLDEPAFVPNRTVLLPGITVTVRAMLDALERVAGRERRALVEERIDPRIAAIVAGWPTRADAVRGRALGFEADTGIEAIVRAHVEDEHGGSLGG